MATLESLRKSLPELSGLDDENAARLLHRRYYSDMPFEDMAKAVGYAPKAEADERGDFGRGLGQAIQQLPQLGYGVVAGAGALIEDTFGEGGVGTGLKKFGAKGYQDWGEKIAATSKQSDSLSWSLDQAENGDFGALVDWLQYGLGYAGGQALQMVATGLGGGALAKAGASTVAKETAKGLVAKEASRIAATEAGRKLASEELVRLATANVTAKIGQIGQQAALGAAAFGMEGGEIFGDLVSGAEKEGRKLTADELAKAFGATLGAGALEFVGDKLGLDLILGKSAAVNGLQQAAGATGRAGRAAVGALAATPIEAGTEYFQTGLENYGKGKEQALVPWAQSEESRSEAFDAAGLGAIGGGGAGLIGGAFSSPTQPPTQPPGVPPAVAPAPSASDQAMADLTRAATADDAINAAMRAVDVPLVSEEQLGRLIDAGQSELKDIATSVKFGSASRQPTPDTPAATARMEEQAALQAMAAVGEDQAPMEFGDRVEALRERLADPAVQEGLAQTGMLDKVVEYAAIADRPDLPIPDATRVQLLTMAEGLVERAAPRAQVEASQAPAVPQVAQEGDLLTADGYPYGTRAAAQVRANRDGGEVVPVDGGFVVRQTVRVPDATGSQTGDLGADGVGPAGPGGGGDLGGAGLDGQLPAGGGRPDAGGIASAAAGPGPVEGQALGDGARGAPALDQDPLFEQARDLVTRTGQATPSAIQREFGVGFNRAARMLESMEGMGVVSAMDNKGQRQVLQPRIDPAGLTTRPLDAPPQTAQPNPVREVVELRKREAVLRDLLACVSS